MKICMIAEGSYPYVTGGVSSWTHGLIQSMPEHQFIILAIGAKEKDRGQFKYTLPANVVQVEELFLENYLQDEPKVKLFPVIHSSIKQQLEQLFQGGAVDWGVLFKWIRGLQGVDMIQFFRTELFFDTAKRIYKEYYPYTPFTEFFWTLRSMFIPLFRLLQQPVPEADLYHSVSTGYGGMMGSLAAWLYHKPLIVTEHGIYSREREEEIIQAEWVKGYFKDIWIHFFYSLSRCAYQYASTIVSLFYKNKQIQMELGCPAEKIEIIPNGVQLAAFQSLVSHHESEVIHIGAVVRLVPIKDIKTMIQSFDIVKRSESAAKFFIMGPTDENEEYYEECKRLVNQLQLQDVIFTGAVDIREYLGDMDILVLTSISEAQPLAVLEGMACKKPYVATNVGCCRELLYGNEDEFGEAGIVCAVMDYEEIGYAILNLCRHPELRKRMGIQGYCRVSKYYTKELWIQSYNELYSRYKGAVAWQA